VNDRISRRVARKAEGPACSRQVRIHEKELVTRIAKVFFDPTSNT